MVLGNMNRATQICYFRLIKLEGIFHKFSTPTKAFCFLGPTGMETWLLNP